MMNSHKKRYVIRQCVIALTGFIFTLQLSAQTSEKLRLSTDELQWILGVSDTEWSEKISGVARLMEDKRYNEVDVLIDDWLTQDFNDAMLNLPVFEHFIFHFRSHDFTPAYIKHFHGYSGPEVIHLLSLFDFNNVAVRYTTLNLFAAWWDEDPHSLSEWIKTHSGFFEDVYTEGLIEKVLQADHDYPALADVFYALQDDDERRVKYFAQVIEHWTDRNFQQTLTYLDAVYNNNGNSSDRAFEKTASTIAYRYVQQSNYIEALNWAAKIHPSEMRDWLVRDLSLNVANEDEKKIFKEWISIYPFITLEAQNEVGQHLENIK